MYDCVICVYDVRTRVVCVCWLCVSYDFDCVYDCCMIVVRCVGFVYDLFILCEWFVNGVCCVCCLLFCKIFNVVCDCVIDVCTIVYDCCARVLFVRCMMSVRFVYVLYGACMRRV